MPSAFEPVKTRVCEGSDGSGFRSEFRMNAVQTETKRGILEAFLTLDEADRREVVRVLSGLVTSKEVAAR